MSVLQHRLLPLVWLTVVWVALWGDVSLGTVLAGLLVALVGLVFTARYTLHLPAFRPLGLIRYAAVFTVMLMQATLAVARVVLSPRLRISPVVCAVHLPPTDAFIAMLVANSVTLTPGTLSLDVAENPDRSWTLVVHALDAPDFDVVRADTLKLYRLASGAFRTQEVTT